MPGTPEGILDARNEVTNPQGRRAVGWIVGVAYHHTVTTVPPDAGEAEERAHLRAIDAYHVRQGYGGFGYHLAVFPSGRTYLCGDLSGQRAHVAGRNHELLGVAAVLDATRQQPTPAQLAGLGRAIRACWDYTGREVAAAGHGDWALPGWETGCPAGLRAYHADLLRHARAGSGPPDTQETEMTTWLHSKIPGNLETGEPARIPFYRFERRDGRPVYAGVDAKEMTWGEYLWLRAMNLIPDNLDGPIPIWGEPPERHETLNGLAHWKHYAAFDEAFQAAVLHAVNRLVRDGTLALPAPGAGPTAPRRGRRPAAAARPTRPSRR